MTIGTDTPAPSPPASLVARLELWLGSVITALGGMLLVAWLDGRDTDRHGMVFAFLGALFLFPLGLMLIVGGLVLRHGGKHRWIAQLAPIAWLLTYVLGFKLLLR
jgi:hypothetical protein